MLESNFKFAYFTIRLRVLSQIQLPYFKGALIRGSFGKLFRRVVCMQKNTDCPDCICRFKCPYAFIFESPRLENNGLWQASHEPHPFVFEPPFDDKRSYGPGEELSLGLLLVGEGIEYLPYFVLVFEDMGKVGIGPRRGRFKVIETVADDLNSGQTIFHGEERTFINHIPHIVLADLNHSKEQIKRLKIDFVTPVRLQHRGKIADAVTFPMLIRAVMRRYSWLSSLYCDTLPDHPYADIVKQSSNIEVSKSRLSWRDLEHYSYRQKRIIRLGGLVGSIFFEGDLEPYMPLLKLGEYLHIGKNTVFGLGKYRLLSSSTLQSKKRALNKVNT